MADETPTTGPVASSASGKQSASSAPPVEEARIIEEVVTKPAPALLHTPEDLQKENAAITNILKDIKLPERRETYGESEKLPGKPKEPHVFDTMLGVSANRINVSDQSAFAALESVKTPEITTTLLTDGAKDVAPNKPTGTTLGENLVSSIVSPLRTLKNDLQNIVRDKKISLVSAVALEGERRHAEGDVAERGQIKEVHSRRVFRILFAVFIFSILGTAAFLGVYVIVQERSGIPRQEQETSILFSENTFSLPLENNTPLEIKRLVAQVRTDKGATLGSITHFVPTMLQAGADGASTERLLTLEEFFNALGTRTSADLLRALSSKFFFGTYTVDETAPIFVIPVLSYERAFAGMLAWEQTMNSDLAPTFTRVSDQVQGIGGLPERRRFEDVVMRNYDVRVLKNDAGAIELYYSFPTRRLLIIGENVYSFTEILSRLRAGRKL